MGRQNKRQASSQLSRRSTRGRNKVAARPKWRAKLWLLPVSLPLLLAAAVAWQWLGPGGAGEAGPISPIGLIGLIGPIAGEQQATRVVPASERIVREGLAVSFSIAPSNGAEGTAEDNGAEMRFTLADAATGETLELESRPAIWVDRQKSLPGEQGKQTPTCEDKVRSYAQGSLGFRPDLDLNSYYVLALNEDASISVIDPLLGVSGISQLYAMVYLKDVGLDWAFSADGRLLFVSLPRAGQVAVVNTDSFKVIKNIEVGQNPIRVALQPDGKYLWVGNDSPDKRKSGVTVIDTETLDVRATIRTGAGAHEMLFVADAVAPGSEGEQAQPTSHHGSSASGSTRLAFVTNREEGTLSIIDTRLFVKIHDIKVGRLVRGLAFSSVANAVYVGSEADNGITVVDATVHEVVGQIEAERGARSLRFAPGGRWGFVLSSGHKSVSILDASTNRFVASVEIGGEPDSVTFTRDYAYIRSPGTAEVSLVDLAQLGQSALPAVTKINSGQRAPGESPFYSVADPIVSIHADGNHVLIANPADSYIYYYMEGMMGPMGGFQNYIRAPRAVAVVDRGIRQVGPGAYWARVNPPVAGKYQVAFLLDSPRIVNCFEFTADAATLASSGNPGRSLKLQLLSGGADVGVGEKASLRFALTDAENGRPVTGLGDVQVVVAHVSGLWSERYRAESVGDGPYAVNLALPRAGEYSVLFAVPSLGLSFNQFPSLSLKANARSVAR
ncbi:MAG: YncE family protein [Chloroflexi bacterium]|nr:YncE family protein [Chloroflexota bacterium]